MGERKDNVIPTGELHGSSIQVELDRVLASATFARADPLRAFLSYVIERSLAVRAHLIAGKTVAHDVYGRAPDGAATASFASMREDCGASSRSAMRTKAPTIPSGCIAAAVAMRHASKEGIQRTHIPLPPASPRKPRPRVAANFDGGSLRQSPRRWWFWPGYSGPVGRCPRQRRRRPIILPGTGWNDLFLQRNPRRPFRRQISPNRPADCCSRSQMSRIRNLPRPSTGTPFGSIRDSRMISPVPRTASRPLPCSHRPRKSMPSY